ncbi:hypothetical protein ASPVEDRAFT_97814, partial [Aspergillus versicolor CBS 583.65]
SLLTTDPAPTVQPSPIVTPARIVAFAPIQQSLPMMTSPVNSFPRFALRALISVKCSPVMILTFGPISTWSPIVT